MGFVDIALKCRVCHQDFVFTAAEQAFFQTRGFTNVPKTCRKCRAKFHGKPPKSDVAVTCAECGAETTVPFRPTQERPVYCRTCFIKRNNVQGTQASHPSASTV